MLFAIWVSCLSLCERGFCALGSSDATGRYSTARILLAIFWTSSAIDHSQNPKVFSGRKEKSELNRLLSPKGYLCFGLGLYGRKRAICKLLLDCLPPASGNVLMFRGRK